MSQAPTTLRGNTSAIDEIRDYLSAQIESGAIDTGGRLPSRSVLARKFNVSFGTVGLAIRRLGESVPLQSVPGAGVYLCKAEGGGARRPAFTIGLIGINASAIACDRTLLQSSSSYLAPVIQRIMLCCQERKLALLTIPDTSKEPLDIDRIASFGVDCLITHGLPHSQETILELRRRGIPIVLGHRGEGTLPLLGASYVDYDARGLFRDAVKVCHERGHRRIASIFWETADAAWMTWRDAFCLEALHRGLNVSVEEQCRLITQDSWQDDEAAFNAALRRQTEFLLDLPQPPTAIFVHQEKGRLEGLYEAISKRGLQAGRDISVVCVEMPSQTDNHPLSCFVEPADLLGEKLVETAQKLAADPHGVFQIEIPMNFVDRGSIVTMKS